MCKVILIVWLNVGKKYVEELGINDIDIEEYFVLIEDYKSEFVL